MMSKEMQVISNKLYDILKFFVEVILPGLGALYATLAGFWGFPKPVEVVGTVAAVALFLGLFLKWSTWKYEQSGAAFQGDVVVNRDPLADKPIELKLNEPMANLVESNKVINLKVVEQGNVYRE